MKKHILFFGLSLAFISPLAGMVEEVHCLPQGVAAPLLEYLQSRADGPSFEGKNGEDALEYLLKNDESYVEGLSTEVAQEICKLLQAGVLLFQNDYVKARDCLRLMHISLENISSSSSSSTDFKINVSFLLKYIFLLLEKKSSQEKDCADRNNGNQLRCEAGHLIKCLSDRGLLCEEYHANKLVEIYCNFFQDGCKRASRRARGSLNLVLQKRPWFVAAVLACSDDKAKNHIEDKIKSGQLVDPRAGAGAGAA